MDTYAFGFNGLAQSCPSPNDQNGDSSQDILTPLSILHVTNISVPWLSWCDVVLSYSSSIEEWTSIYRGEGLTRASATQFSELASEANKFFGGIIDLGLKGIVKPGAGTDGLGEVTIFDEDGPVETYRVRGAHRIEDIRLASNGNMLISTQSRFNDSDSRIILLKNLDNFKSRLSQDDWFLTDSNYTPLADFIPDQLCLSATASTALKDGVVYTYSGDNRYPKCLGRPFESGDEGFQPIPYLSETTITKIASGGYMSAAISTEGELFLWGQACPGVSNELAILKDNEIAELGIARINEDEEQDEFVKCVPIKIDGLEAGVYDVAVGFGHILIAAEIQKTDGEMARKVFAAGQGERGQLGIGERRHFSEELKEIEALRGKKVESLHCAGWSSFVVVSS